ncbi:MAG: hypothetical protein ABOK23_05780 [Candidatus Methanoperedens sp.]|nr:hypothetical protein [Candidatus Methanoperedens sp.]MCZ7396116.1 hypothetical protein [Candidatus Methanoperedens sp.]
MLLRKDILDCDLTRFPAVVYLALIFLVSRAPFIALGFSAFTNPTDQDVLAVVNSAYLLRYEHVYTVSRFPGYPFFEMFNSLLIGGGWVFTNIATAVVSFISLILFGKILNVFEIKNKALLLLTFAFIPIIWINSTITMDYMWALMFILLAVFFVFTDKYQLAGISMGFAIGTRFTSAFMIFPVVLCLLEKVNRRKILIFISTAVGTAVLLFLPVIYRYKLEFFRGSGFLYTTPIGKSISMAAGSLLLSLNNMVMELFGIAALAALIFFAILTFKNKPFYSSERGHLLNFCWLTILIFILLYFIFPYKVAYLIPAVPWGLIALNEKLERKFIIIICILLLLNSAVSVEILSDDVTQVIKLDPGVVIKNYEDRKSLGVELSKEYMESLSNLLRYEK